VITFELVDITNTNNKDIPNIIDSSFFIYNHYVIFLKKVLFY
jgi:hypothetical protein